MKKLLTFILVFTIIAAMATTVVACSCKKKPDTSSPDFISRDTGDKSTDDSTSTGTSQSTGESDSTGTGDSDSTTESNSSETSDSTNPGTSDSTNTSTGGDSQEPTSSTEGPGDITSDGFTNF